LSIDATQATEMLDWDLTVSLSPVGVVGGCLSGADGHAVVEAKSCARAERFPAPSTASTSKR
jgi:hypothetical protein